MNQTEWLAQKKGSPKRVSYGVFPSDKEILNVSQIGKSIPWNLPTIFHPDLIATILQTYLLSLCTLLFPQYHQSPIGVV